MSTESGLRVLVTGATGFVGGAVTRALLAAGHDVLALVRTAAGAADLGRAGARPALGDIRRPETYRPLVAEVDCVVHAAQRRVRGRVSRRQVALLTATDRIAVETLGDACAAAGRRLVYTSGAFVFGDHADRWIDERTPVDPSPLGSWHAAGVRRLRGRAGLDLVVLHLGFVYGPGGTFRAVLHDPARRGLLRCIGPGTNYWSPVHLDDVASGYLAAVERAPAGAEYILADDEPLPLRRLVDQVTDRLGRKRVGSVPPGLVMLAAGGPAVASLTTSYRLSNRRARDELGWRPGHPTFADGLPATLDALAASRRGPVAVPGQAD